MGIQDLISRLDHCKKVSGGYIARCPAHDDRSPSLSITEKKHRETGEDIILIHCHAGCGATEVLDAVGLDHSVLYPNTDITLYRAKKREDQRTVDDLVLEIAAADRRNGRKHSPADIEREAEAFARKLLDEPSPNPDEPLFEAWAYRQSRKIKKVKNPVRIPEELANQSVDEWLADYFGEA